jgi:uncharacterized phage protein (TIGR02220 family)
MAASVRLDDEAFSDERFEVLASECGLADGDHARGKLARLWRQCTAQATYVLPERVIATVLGRSGPDALVSAGLGERVPEGIRLRGTYGRIEWLGKLRANSALGGEATKRKWETNKGPDGGHVASQTDSQTEAKAGPIPGLPIPDPIPDLNSPHKPPKRIGRPRKPRLGEPSDAELAIVHSVLGKLGSRNGVSYSGSKAHVALIIGRLRDGYDEMDLRKVIGYCAEQWRGKPEMLAYLRPETLFGPTTITRYADAARAWFDSLPKERDS